jgi:hypothetical protein
MSEIVKFNEIAATVPQVLEQSKTRVLNATTVGQAVYADMGQMDDAKDEKANAYLVKARKTLDLINTERKPVTQFLDAIKKEFTQIERELDPKNADSIVAKIQQRRNEYATAKLEAQKKKEEEAKRIAAIQQEKADTEASIELALNNYFADFLSKKIQNLQELYNGMNLTNFDEFHKLIAEFPEFYPQSHFDAFTTSVTTIYLTKDDKFALKVRVSDGKHSVFSKQFQDKIRAEKIDLISKLPAKKAELEEMAKATSERAAEMIAAKAKREQEEKERIARERKEAEEKAAAEAKAKQEAAKMQALFDAQQAEKVNRTGYEITVKHPAGFGLIFQLWYEYEGKNLAIDQMEKKSLGQMKAFCEKHAHKNDEKLESPYISYKEIVKTAARK